MRERERGERLREGERDSGERVLHCKAIDALVRVGKVRMRERERERETGEEREGVKEGET